jgi:hypothetical protein
MKNKYYVYAYLDPRYRENLFLSHISFLYRPIYIGKGSGFRYRDHLLREGRKYRGCNRVLECKLKKLKKGCLEPVVIILKDNLSEKESFDLEKSCISSIGKIWDGTGSLLNFLDGGEGPSIPKSVRKKMSIARKEWLKSNDHPMKGLKHSDKTKKQMSKNHNGFGIGDNHSYESKKKISDKNKRPKLKSCSSYKVTSPNGEILLIDDGLNRFCEEKELHLSSMVAVSKGRRKHHKGWVCEMISNPKTSLFKIIGAKGDTFTTNNLRKFCREHCLTNSCMLRVANGERKHHKGWVCERI